ncbi:putative vesicle-mediated transport protein (Imh1) [Aspergillus affinis]|uniref:putative vesicle-mediated transport protein (Imh1) n=1 Tax=Aspergillus affinis TaxID=1070780 RepID=UPI0022FE2AB5|nr:uncharacterized protein KD926_004410 [Aspergillus affinis]KAI9043226.1 hypothetical protein KD926_004410 [Aspergillus affinis]
MKDFTINTTAKVNGPTFMVVVWGATLLSFIFIAARILARILTFRRLWTDDVLAMLAWLFVLAQAIIWHTQVESLYVQHQLITKEFLPTEEIMEEIRWVLRAQLLGLFFFMFSLWLLKASFLVFFRRIGCYLQPLNTWYWCVVILVTTSCAACLGDIDYKCLTKDPTWGYEHCTPFSAVKVQFRGFLVNALLDIFSDVLITTLPIALLWNVRMPLSRKLKLMGLFSLTVVVAIFAVVRIAAVAQPHHYFDATWLWMWSLIECAADPAPLTTDHRPFFFISGHFSARPESLGSPTSSGLFVGSVADVLWMLPPISLYHLFLLLLFVSFRLVSSCLSFIHLAVALAHRPATVMFQRLREAIDSRIAEEQARQKSAQDSLSRSNSARQPSGRNLSPSRRQSRPRRNTGTPVRGPDPNEFEQPEFTIGDDEGSSRSATPQQDPPSNSMGSPEQNAGEEKSTAEESPNGKDAAPAGETKQSPSELPAEVKVKLRKLSKMETRYQELLKAYRMAHTRVLSIEPFEAALRENTPLTSIGDPKALTEYLNQISLKGDMVVEELKRISGERDDYKKKFEEAQQATKAAYDEVANLKKNGNKSEEGSSSKEGDGLSVDTAAANAPSPDITVQSATPTSASRLAQIFSPKQNSAKQAEKPEPQQESEEFFSFDGEIPRLETELKEKQEEIETLKTQTEKLQRDLSVARESTEGMVQNLETATRELSELRDTKDKQDSEIEKLKASKQEGIDELKSRLVASEESLTKATAEVEKLKDELKQKATEIEQLQAQVAQSEKDNEQPEIESLLEELKKEKETTKNKLGVLQNLVDSLRSQLKTTEETVSSQMAVIEQKNKNAKSQAIVDFFDGSVQDNPQWQQSKAQILSGEKTNFDELREILMPLQKEEPVKSQASEPNPPPTNSTANSTTGTGGGKKKNKKKKKGGKGGEDTSKAEPSPAVEDKQPPSAEPDQIAAKLDELQGKIESLTNQLEEKEAAIDRLSAKLKGEDDLKEEIESLRDDLLNIGQEHVEAKDKFKVLSAEKNALIETISKLEKEITDLRTSNASQSADSEKAHSSLKEEYESLKVKFTTIETELSAAQQLATTRFKDLTDLRETVQKLQPELKNLRAESAELKSTKETLTSKTTELRNLEHKQEDLRAELKTLKSTVSERDTEVKTLNQKIRQETDNRLKAEERLTLAQSDLRYSESKKQEAVETKERFASDLSRAQEELKSAKNEIREVENQVNKLNQELGSLREEIHLKTAQHASAQSLMNSMRDQSAEIGMQMKEAKERCESLEEELADAHRLLNERTREGETMRRLLNDIEGRTESKVRDFKERMEAAIEERDRAEDEASSQGRRRARELEELKSKVREAEKALRSAEEDKEELERSQKDWKRRRDQLEAQSETSGRELNDVRQAMAQLRDTLDESEKQVRELEKERAEYRRSVEEANARLEKMRKSNRILSDEARMVQPQSSRSSIDSGSRKALTSPVTKDRSPSTRRSESSGANVDYIYLKNVLLQFLEQKDRNYQKQLIPVLGMLLHFDRTDEQKWMSAIMSK